MTTPTITETSALETATSARPDLLSRLLGAPAPLRDADLLSRDQPLKPYPPLHRWRYNAGLRGLFFLGIFALLSMAPGAVIGIVLAATGRGPDEISAFISNYASVLMILAAVVAYVLLVRVLEQRRDPYEISPRRALHGLGVGLAMGTIFMLVCAGLLGLLGVFQVHGFNADYLPWRTIMTVGFVAGIVEEIIFRGIIYRLVEDIFGSWIAIAFSAVLFGLVHLGNPNATWQGAIGIALEAGLLFAALYALTRSLWLVMGLHFAWNVVQGPILGIVVSGSTDGGAGFLNSTMTGPELLSGGVFGLEASMLTIVLLTAVGVWFMVELGRRGLAVQPFWVRRRLLQG